MKLPLLQWLRPDSLSSLRRAPSTPTQPRHLSDKPAHILRLGGTISGCFYHHKEMIHAICQVEDQRAATLCLHLVAEMGKVSLIGLRKGTSGHIEVGNLVFPCEVTHAALPKIQVVIFPQHAQPARRQLLRVPASFLVRVRRQGSEGLWISGQGVDISAGGCSFLLTPPYTPKPGSPYDIDMLLTLPRHEEERPFLTAEVRWVKTTNQQIYVGIETSHPAQRRTLTNVTAKVQQALSRHPEDYLLA